MNRILTYIHNFSLCCKQLYSKISIYPKTIKLSDNLTNTNMHNIRISLIIEQKELLHCCKYPNKYFII